MIIDFILVTIIVIIARAFVEIILALLEYILENRRIKNRKR